MRWLAPVALLQLIVAACVPAAAPAARPVDSSDYSIALDGSERIQQIVQMERVFTEEVAAIPYLFTIVVDGFRRRWRTAVTTTRSSSTMKYTAYGNRRITARRISPRSI